MQITEPSTLITDYLLGAVCFFLAARLLRGPAGQGGNAVVLWAGAFVFTGVAAVAGGSHHGFQTLWPPGTDRTVWTITLGAVGAASFCFLSSSLIASLSGRVVRVLVGLAVVKLAIYLFWMGAHPDFRYAIYDYVPSMVAVLVIQLYALVTRGQRGAYWVVAGIVVSFAAAGVEVGGFSIHPYFNQNDIYHVVQMAGMYCFYRGGVLIWGKN